LLVVCLLLRVRLLCCFLEDLVGDAEVFDLVI